MLFNSLPFILCFLPVTLIGFHLMIGRLPLGVVKAWLVVCSLFFYAYWHPAYLLLLLVSIVFNYYMAHAVFRVGQARGRQASRVILITRIALNLGLLVYFKYLGFFASILGGVTG